MPSSAVREVHPVSSVRSGRALSAGDRSNTPSVPDATASAAGALIGSPRKASPKTATCSTSVFE